MRRAAGLQRLAGAALALLAGAVPARAETLVVELSTPLISVESDFHGSAISLFGVIERDAQTISRRGPYQIIATVSGPVEDVLVQQKARRLGIWLNTEQHLFTDVPSYYAIYASESARPLLQPGGAAAGLAVSRVGFLGERREPFREALEAERIASGQFRQTVGAVDLLTKSFFRSLIRIPAVAETGTYTVTIHLYADGVRLDLARLSFALRKAGYGARLWSASRDHPLLYGIGAVALALITGYVGGVVFRRN